MQKNQFPLKICRVDKNLKPTHPEKSLSVERCPEEKSAPDVNISAVKNSESTPLVKPVSVKKCNKSVLIPPDNKNPKKTTESSQPVSVIVEKSVENPASILTKAERKFIAKPVVVLEKVIDRFVEKPVSVLDKKFTIIYENSIPVPETKAQEIAKSAKSKNKHMDKAVSVKPSTVTETKNTPESTENHPVNPADSSYSRKRSASNEMVPPPKLMKVHEPMPEVGQGVMIKGHSIDYATLQSVPQLLDMMKRLSKKETECEEKERER